MTVFDHREKWDRMMEAYYRAEGVTGWVGVLSGRPRYAKTYRSWKYAKAGPSTPAPKKRKKRGRPPGQQTAVAQVAGVLQAEGQWVSQAIDKHMPEYEREWMVANRALVVGEDPAQVMGWFCEGVRKRMRAELERLGYKRSGRLIKAIGWRVGIPRDLKGLMTGLRSKARAAGQQPHWAAILGQAGET